MKLLLLQILLLLLSILPFENIAANAVSFIDKDPTLSSSQKVEILPHQAHALKQIKPSNNLMKTIEITLVELTDNQGLVYLGGLVNEATISVYLAHLKAHLKAQLNEQYPDFRQNQMNRDHGQFHMTLVNPFEYQKIDKNQIIQGRKFMVTLHGLGKVEKDNSATYFVVASSEDGRRFRDSLLLSPKDFHVTLGFNPNDIYSERKNLATLIDVE
ncbi:hypothetical protein [Thalassotalea profundi]|uniref:Swiss Army Knife 2H phosphoesterase domain-containing protein n=1 Tax=Thalassotalea profundi TaxID=2036687 RepID=A0ABQ3IYU5_9GAMM|nr:hypothetical protein [Thalassotalea profundi]GHE98785.1 hypothetical protein GCM10011501_30450 [Thalassotalea profundi]